MAQVDIQKQEPFTTSQIQTTRPNTKRSTNLLSGYIANSMNGGMNKVIAFKKIMAGEKVHSYRLKCNFQMLTPITPTFQNLKMTIRAYFVPNSRVWKNAEKYTAQKGGTAEIKITEIPNLKGKKLPIIPNTDESRYILYTETEAYRDSFLSSYIPRITTGVEAYDQEIERMAKSLPEISVLPLRGRIAIYNDMERNKEYDSEIQEYNADTVSNAEWNLYTNGVGSYDYDIMQMRAKRPNSYYTNYRTELQGFEQTYPPDDMSSDTALINWATWESRIAETRSQAQNAQKNDWDIIAELRGSRVLTEGKVQKIAEKTFNLNYSAITQNTYNNNEDIREDFRVLGKQGAYSYTEIDLLLFSGVEFIEEGYLHIIATASADTVFENAIDRNLINVTPLNEYRPDLITEKNDILYQMELGTEAIDESDLQNLYNTSIGFKRKFSEYFKLPNVIGGDMTNRPYKQNAVYNENWIQGLYDSNKEILTNNTYQFFENDASLYRAPTGNNYRKKSWKDYTDLMINKNQAILNEISQIDRDTGTLKVSNQNQIFFVGIHQAIVDMPIDESIKEDYLTWGEH